jgi:hypothetical protein
VLFKRRTEWRAEEVEVPVEVQLQEQRMQAELAAPIKGLEIPTFEQEQWVVFKLATFRVPMEILVHNLGFPSLMVDMAVGEEETSLPQE